MAKAALPRLRTGASLLTLSYLGAVRYVPNYNTMGLAKASLEASVRFLAQSLGAKGVRVNAISAGPIKTLASSGIKDIGKLLADFAAQAPIRRNVTIDDVGNASRLPAVGPRRRGQRRGDVRRRRFQPGGGRPSQLRPRASATSMPSTAADMMPPA